jgi:hypothetical protein
MRTEVLQDLLRQADVQPTLDVFVREPLLRGQTAAEEAAASKRRRPGECMRRSWADQHLFLHPSLNRIAAVLIRLQREPTPALVFVPA